MRLLAFILLSLAAVFAFPIDRIEKRGPPASGCLPSTLKWVARQTQLPSVDVRQDSFILSIQDRYYGYVPPHTAQENVFLEAKDKRWSVKHGEVAMNKTLTLAYADQTFAFDEYHAKKKNAGHDDMGHYYEIFNM
ncbi:hypothetical protein BGZ96_011634 [Linnemannia gamsii]|uniref:Uncharacterized protein n=1 Tax=Linnemannia gamsii TaxID=64522 RepID=A0ABQ7JS86_9FUNG|nr:hypothetical protein BGZ96_011634 [Linnemannia gamsii]